MSEYIYQMAYKKELEQAWFNGMFLTSILIGLIVYCAYQDIKQRKNDLLPLRRSN